MSTLETNLIQPATGTALQVGASGDTITVPSGATFNVAGTLQSGGNAVANTAEFLAYRGSSSQTGIADNTWTKAQINSESYDPDGVYDNSTNYRFTAPSAGKYMLYTNISPYDSSTDIETYELAFYKNGSIYSQAYWQKNSGNRLKYAHLSLTQVANLSSSDYIEVYVKINTVDGGTTDIEWQSGVIQNYFGGYKLIT